MSWDPIWEKIFKSQEWGKYPSEALIRVIARRFFRSPVRADVRILELGFGGGANIWFLAREGFSAYGIEGAPSGLEQAELLLRRDGLSATLRTGDIGEIEEIYSDIDFDAIVDVGCLCCNKLKFVQKVLSAAHERLKPGGLLFASLPDVETTGYGTGTEVEPGTFTEISEGPLAGRGLIHFFTLEEIQEAFQSFDRVQIEFSSRSFDERKSLYKLWNVQAVK